MHRHLSILCLMKVNIKWFLEALFNKLGVICLSISYTDAFIFPIWSPLPVSQFISSISCDFSSKPCHVTFTLIVPSYVLGIHAYSILDTHIWETVNVTFVFLDLGYFIQDQVSYIHLFLWKLHDLFGSILLHCISVTHFPDLFIN